MWCVQLPPQHFINRISVLFAAAFRPGITPQTLFVFEPHFGSVSRRIQVLSRLASVEAAEERSSGLDERKQHVHAPPPALLLVLCFKHANPQPQPLLPLLPLRCKQNTL